MIEMNLSDEKRRMRERETCLLCACEKQPGFIQIPVSI